MRSSSFDASAKGTQIEEDHMRNRQMVVGWLMANSQRIDVRRRDGKTYYVMVDRQGVPGGRRPAARRGPAHQGRRRLRRGAGAVRDHGVHFDPALRDEVVARVDMLQMPSYTGFVQPRLSARCATLDGTITDVTISYPLDLTPQMLEYSGQAIDEPPRCVHSPARDRPR